MDKKIRFHAAPMEGLTGFAWRKAHRQVFGSIDKYYSPFVVANQTHKFKTKELRDLTQEEEGLVPQVLTDKPEHFLWACGELKAMGFDEINFNMGCPSATVTTRGKGSAILKDPVHLDQMLDEIFNGLCGSGTSTGGLKISIKTRIGFEDASLWPQLLEVFSKYPISQLIIHPRLRSQFYEGLADRQIFKDSLLLADRLAAASHMSSASCIAPANHLTAANHIDESGLIPPLDLVYNGDILDPGDEAFAYGCDLMAGRGLLRNPALFRMSQGGPAPSADELTEYHQLMLEYYSQYMSGDGPVIHHMKSMWIYLADLFDCDDRDLKKLKKAKTLSEYRTAAAAVLRSPMREG